MSQPNGKEAGGVPLSRSLKLLETIALTVAAVAPTAGVFIIVPVALVATGTGTFYIMAFARTLYCSGRDHAWPQPISRWIATVSPNSRAPWVATLVLGVPIVVLTAVSNVAEAVTFTGVLVTIVYVVVTLSAIASRWRKIPREREYRMPLWPSPDREEQHARP